MTILDRIEICKGYELRTRQLRDCYGHPRIVRELLKVGPPSVVIGELRSRHPDLKAWAMGVIRMYELNQRGRGGHR